MNGADVLVKMLIGYGVDTVFGVSGDTNVQFYESFQVHEDAITHVTARDERPAGFVPDDYPLSLDAKDVMFL